MRLAALALLVAGCAHGPTVLARGTLAYDVAAAPGVVATLELETEFQLVLRRGGQVLRTALGPPERDFVDLALDGAGRLAAVAGLDGTVRLFDAVTGAERARYRLDSAARAVALTPDGAYLVTGAESGVVCLRRTADGALLQCVVAHDRPIASLVASQADVISGDDRGLAVVWTLPALRRVAAGPAPKAPARAEHGKILIGARMVGRFAGTVHGMAFSPDGRWLYVAGFTTRDLKAPSVIAIRVP